MTSDWNGVDERRRTPRLPVDQQVDCRVVMRARVKLLDVSLTGALLISDAALPTGALGRLETVLTGQFAPIIEVRRSSAPQPAGRRELGVQFQRMDDRSRTHLESFLSRGSE